MIEERYPEYDDARISTAIEASDHLDSVMSRLTELVGPPAPQAFTLTFAGRERHIGKAPTSFVVNACDINDAVFVLSRLPSWREWYLADAAESDNGADIIYLPEQSHPGLPTRGEFNDLRAEQRPAEPAHTSALATLPRSASPVPAPANPAARTLH
ncbi:hypothetical protein [Streptomyces orinoci]|uniref:Uncharacterized protein n=1 Tax=Streptomyces orinoci TaxID=67339 RepID=A0ABV3JUL3_STRON|nr:hypothetical protein [Streptomyces orinoci]